MLALPRSATAEAGKDDKDADYRFLLKERKVTVGKDGLKTVRIHNIIKLLKRPAIEYAGDIEVGYNAFYEKAHLLAAFTTTPDGRRVPISNEAVHDLTPAEISNYKMYSDARVLTFSMPALAVDAVVDYEVEIGDKGQLMPGHVWDMGTWTSPDAITSPPRSGTLPSGDRFTPTITRDPPHKTTLQACATIHGKPACDGHEWQKRRGVKARRKARAKKPDPIILPARTCNQDEADETPCNMTVNTSTQSRSSSVRALAPGHPASFPIIQPTPTKQATKRDHARKAARRGGASRQSPQSGKANVPKLDFRENRPGSEPRRPVPRNPSSRRHHTRRSRPRNNR